MTILLSLFKGITHNHGHWPNTRLIWKISSYVKKRHPKMNSNRKADGISFQHRYTCTHSSFSLENGNIYLTVPSRCCLLWLLPKNHVHLQQIETFMERKMAFEPNPHQKHHEDQYISKIPHLYQKKKEEMTPRSEKHMYS